MRIQFFFFNFVVDKDTMKQNIETDCLKYAHKKRYTDLKTKTFEIKNLKFKII